MLHPISRKIIKILMTKEGSITTAGIAAQIGISPRSVRYRLPEIQNWLSRRSIELIIKPNLGLLIQASTEKRNKLLHDLVYTPTAPDYVPSSERMQMVVLILLLSPRPVQIKQIAYQFSLARGTLLKDLEKADLWINRRGLSMVRKTNYGIKIVGSEQNIRDAIIELLFQIVQEDRLITICENPVEIQPKDVLQDGYLLNVYAYLLRLELNSYFHLITDIQNRLGTDFTDEGKVSLTLFVALTSHRVKAGCKIDPNSYPESVQKTREFVACASIADYVIRKTQLQLSVAELSAIAIRLISAPRKASPLADELKDGNEDHLTEVLEIIKLILDDASLYLHPYLQVDQVLIKGLTHHINTTCIRLKYGLFIKNPLLEKIKVEYEYIYAVSLRCAKRIDEVLHLTLPDEEIGYITMFLAAAMERVNTIIPKKIRAYLVCNEGVATSWLLASRLRTEFPQIEIAEVLSLSELYRKNKNMNDIDVILSTVLVSVNKIPVIQVSPLLPPNDVKLIWRILRPNNPDREKVTRPREYQKGPSLTRLLTEKTIQVIDRVSNWKTAVEVATIPLITNGAVIPDYINAMKRAVLDLGPYMVIWPGIALLHASPDDGVRRLGISLTLLVKPVKFGHVLNDPVDIIIVLAAIDKWSHLRALLDLIDLCNNSELIKKIRSTRSVDELATLLTKPD